MLSGPASAILTRQNGKWYVVFHVEVDALDRAGPDSVGIDFGLTSLIALSNGETEPRPNWTKKAAKGLGRRASGQLSDASGRSKTRAKRVAALARYHAHIANRRRDHLHPDFPTSGRSLRPDRDRRPVDRNARIQGCKCRC
jgi:putative transposase